MKSIATKLLISIGIVTFVFSTFFLYQTYSLTNRRVRNVIEQQASMALKFDLAIRDYIAENVRSVMYELLGKEEFTPETMSTSYVARAIFEDVQKEFPNYIIKFASDNPRNPLNQAGPEELKVIEYLNSNPHLSRWEGVISIDGEQYVSKFSAMRMEESCLRCHGDPKDAPASLLKRYGSTGGFHRPLDEVIGLDTIAIPMAKISEQLWPELMQAFLVSGIGLLLFFWVIIFITRFMITNRLTMISKHFKNAAQQEDYSNINPIEIKGKDEIFDLVFSFNALSEKLKSFYYSLEVQVKERTRELKDTNAQLRQEINERKQIEEILKSERSQLLSIFGSIDEIIYVTDPYTHEILYVNQAMKDAFQKELVGGICHKEFQGLDSPCKFCTNEIILEQKPAPYAWEYHNLILDRYYAITDRIIKWPDGRDVRFEIAIDITERKQAEEALRESNRRNELLLDSLPHPAMLIDPDRTILAANRIAREAGAVVGGYCWRDFGQSEYISNVHKQYISKNQIPPDGIKCTFCLADEAATENKPKNNPEIKAFGLLWDVWWIPIDDDVFLHYGINITKRKELEDHLRQSHKMEAIGTLAGGIAHEFNNILGIIIGNTELAINDVPEWNPAHDCLQEIRTASLRAKDVVRQIMSFARKTPATRKPINISTIVKESLKLIRATTPTSIEIRQEILCDSEMILANPTEINQILMNLCSNSAHAMADETGILEVQLETVALDVRTATGYENLRAGDYVKLTVKDTGTGIDLGIMDRILDPYFTTKDVDKGLGMGLAVVSGLVKKHDGAIKITSAVGKGTTAEVLFPVTQEKAETKAQEYEGLPAGTERILVIDDEASIVRVVSRMLEQHGYQVVGITSSPEALRLFQTDPDQFDLVITDTAMPDITGDRLAQELIKIRPEIPVILCTGHSDRIDEDKAKALGFSAYTMKPIDMEKFPKMVREILDKTKS